MERLLQVPDVASAEAAGPGFVNLRLQPEAFRSLLPVILRAGEAYEPINQTFRLIADTLDMEVGGQLTRPESHLLPYKLSKPMTLKRVESAFLKAGHEV